MGPGGAWTLSDEGGVITESQMTRRGLLRADLAITIGFLIMAVAVLLQARGWPFRAAVFPIVTSLALLGLVLLKLVIDVATAWRKTTAIQGEGAVAPAAGATSESPGQRPRPGLGDGSTSPETRPRLEFRRGAPRALKEEMAAEDELIDVFATASRRQWVSAFGSMAAFFVMLWLLGVLVTVPLFAVIYLLVASRESPVLACSYALGCWAFVYGLFDQLLHVPLPCGVLLTGLGL
jgi:Tripartite tricarboxylate transporter TctB family